MTAENNPATDARVFLYALSTCSHCKDVKKLLDKKGVKYEAVEVDRLEGEDRKKAIATVKKYNSRVTFPTSVIGDTVIVGSKKDKIEEALSKIEE